MNATVYYITNGDTHTFRIVDVGKGTPGEVQNAIQALVTDPQEPLAVTEKVILNTCPYCGQPISDQFENPTCPDCQDWLDILAEDDENSFMIDGAHYTVEPDVTHKVMVGDRLYVHKPQGFHGAKFVIAANDGRRIETRNLWLQGRVPDHLRHLFPDNAKFEGIPATTVTVRRTPWEEKHLPR